MKKNRVPIGLVALAASAIASAQSSVTVFGVVDAAVSGYSNRSEDRNTATIQNPVYLNQGGVKIRRTALVSSGYNASRLGFRGTEDLGGGLAASFWLEAPITNDDGSTGISAFARRSTVSLSGPFGEFRLGRDYTPSFWNDNVFDPFVSNGVGTNLLTTAQNVNMNGGADGFGANVNYIRASNSIGYLLPANLRGFYGQFQYAFHEQAKYNPGTLTPPGVGPTGVVNPGVTAPSRAGRYVGGRFGYARGPLDIAIAYGKSITADSFFVGTTDLVTTINLGASFDFGGAKLMGEVARARHVRDSMSATGARPAVDLSGYLLGLTIPIGPGLVRASYSHVKYDLNAAPSPFSPVNPRAHKLAVGYVHNLSKRTALYATLARVGNKHGASLSVNGPLLRTTTYTPRSSMGYDVGIRHAF